MPAERLTYQSRRRQASAELQRRGLAALLVSPGSDLAYLAGYRVHTSERLTCLVIGADGAATLVVPELESPRAKVAAPDIPQRPWSETEDPYAIVAGSVTAKGDVAVADQMWSSFVLRLQSALEGRGFQLASVVTRGLRMRKDAYERQALRAVSAAADRAFPRILEHDFTGRTEREIGAALAALLRDEGHDEVTFTIVASGPNGASPHHETGERRIARGDAVVLDFGGTREWYCSDITRTVHVGDSVDDEVRRVHDVVRRAQEAGYAAARIGATAASVDAASRGVIDDAGYGERFIHRTGHGIGLDGHEHPYLVRGNDERLEAGMAFSIEPGVYIPGRFGVRIEDIAVLGEDGRAEPLNRADHALAIVR
ncbi:MAG TPA: Xaa-Pro peptidase family protein [Candidatus Limnocylindria bacterium]|nr:Xaa-Pro peptidase family protein [Candidatus Limnocylindria bacterium]